MPGPRLLTPLAGIAAGIAAAALLRRRSRSQPAQGQEITELLSARHEQVRTLIHRYHAAGDPEERLRIFDDLRRLLSIHEAVEEQAVHPVARKAVPGGHAIVVRVLQQEQESKELLATLERGRDEDGIDEALLEKLFESVERHATTEETELFPQLRLHLDTANRQRMGALAERIERLAPTHPHPKAPDTPPGNVLVGVPAAVLDRARDRLSEPKG